MNGICCYIYVYDYITAQIGVPSKIWQRRPCTLLKSIALPNLLFERARPNETHGGVHIAQCPLSPSSSTVHVQMGRQQSGRV